MNTLKQLKKRKVRASAEASLTTSANAPNSGITFVDNSQGCSAAITELSKLLDDVLDKFDYEKELNDQLQQKLKRLYNEASKYDNSRLGDSAKITEWNCTTHEAEIVSVAFACAAAVYQSDMKPELPGFTFEQQDYIAPSIGGTTKATEIFVVSSQAAGEEPNVFLPMIVVAVRGTASHVDRMINLNSDAKELTLFVSDGSKSSTFHAHARFLNSTETLMPSVSKRIEEIVAKRSMKHVLFTGHSAGGAVASLLFAKHLSLSQHTHSALKLSSISFGAPPTTRPSLESYFNSLNPGKVKNRGLLFSIVNEHDLVPRADGAYLRSLVDLYRSIYNLPPIQGDNVEETKALELPRFDFEPSSEVSVDEKRVFWPLPKPVYWHIGQLVVLKVKVAEQEKDGGGKEDVLILNGLTLPPEDFAKLVFCNVAVHRRLSYKERVDMLVQGRFNGREHWD